MGPYGSTEELPAPAPLTLPPASPAPSSQVPPPMLPSGFGMTAAEGSYLERSPGLYPYAGMPTPLVETPTWQPLYMQQMNAVSTLTGGAIGAGNDPRQWTLDEAQAQTEAAIAKIAQTNPELAQDLATQHGMQVPGADDGGGGFWGTLMGGLGKALEITHLDDVLEVISRPAKILPEMIMDWGEESVWKNIGDAMSGNSDVSWDDVLVEKFGMERNWFTAALGFVGDVALDPLTYIPLGRLAGLGRQMTSMTAGKAVFIGEVKEVAEQGAKRATQATAEQLTRAAAGDVGDDVFLKRLADDMRITEATQVAFAQGAKTLDEAGALLWNTSDIAAQASADAAQGIMGKVVTKLHGVDPDALPGVLNDASEKLAGEGLKVLNRRASAAVEVAYQGNFAKATKMLEAQGVSKEYADRQLRQWVKEGTGFLPGGKGKGLYMRGNMAATQLGGWRFHLNIPVLGVRIAPKRILPKAVPMLNLSMGRRWFAGISGAQKLQRMVGKKLATVEDYQEFIQNGFSGLRKNAPDVAKQLAGGRWYGMVGSPYMAASEQVGRFTQRLSPRGQLMRKGGLGGMRAASLMQQRSALQQSHLTELQTVTMLDGKTVLNGKGAEEYIMKGLSAGLKDDATRATLSTKLSRFVQVMPDEAVGTDVKSMVDSLRPGTLTPTQVDELKGLEAYFHELGDNGFESAMLLRQQARQAETIPQRTGWSPDVDRFGFEDADDLTPADAARAAESTGLDYLQDAAWVDASGDAAWTQDDILGLPERMVDVTAPGATARGLHLRREVGGIATDPVAREKALNRATLAQRQAESELAELRRQVGGGGGVVVMDDLESFMGQVRAAEAKLAKANAELTGLTGKSNRVVVYARNGVTVDRRVAGEAAEAPLSTPGKPLPRDVEARVRALADQVTPRARAMEEAAEEAMAPELKRLAKQMETSVGNIPAAVTRELQAQGIDHIRIINPDGVEELIVFPPPRGKVPVARITPDAPHKGAGHGSTLRGITDEAYAAVRKSKAASNRPGGGKMWLDQLARRTAMMGDDEAEEFIQNAMREAGVGLGKGKRATEGDFLKALSNKQYAASRVMMRHTFAEAGRTLERLGLTSTVTNGYLTGLATQRWVVPGDVLSKLDNLTEEVRSASERSSVYHRQKVKELEDVARSYSENLQLHYAARDDIIEALDVPTYESVAGRRADGIAPEVTEELNQARIGSRATDLGDGIFMAEDEFGTRTLYATSSTGGTPLDAATEPYGLKPVPEGMVRVAHETPKARMGGIQSKGVAKAREAYELVGPDGGAFVYADDARVLKRMLGGPTGTPAGNIVVEAFVPSDRVVISATGEAIVKGGIAPGEIVGYHAPGLETVVGFRRIDVNGRVEAVADATPGIRDRLVKKHWDLEGVYDAEDRVAAAAEQIRRQGLTGPHEKRIGGVGKGGVVTPEGMDIESRLHRQLREAQEEFELANMSLEADIAETERLVTQLSTEAAQVQPALVPVAENSLNMAGMEVLDDIPGFEGLAMPTVMAQEFRQAIEGFGGLEGAHAQFRKFNAWWKSHATWMWPGFHVRNLYGAFFNNMLGGVDIKDYILAGRVRRAYREAGNQKPGKWLNTKLAGSGHDDVIAAMRREGHFWVHGKEVEELTYGDLAAMTTSMGVSNSNGQSLIKDFVAASEGEGTVRTWLEKGALPGTGGMRGGKGVKVPGLSRLETGYARMAMGAGSGTENIMRTAAFVRGLKSYGTAVDARAFTMMRHGDYADLTDFEYGVVRDLIPFYKWMRTNVPFQVHQLLENPAKLLAVQKAQGAVFTGIGMDYDEQKYKQPKWMGESFIIPRNDDDPTNDDGYNAVMLDLPMADLHTGTRDFASSFLPFVRPFIESYVIDQSIFTGAPLTGEKVPLAGVFNLPGVRDLLSVTGFASKGPGGELYTDDKTRNLLGIIPVFSRFRDWLYAEPDRAQNRMWSLMSASLGVTPRSVDEKSMTSAELDFYYSQVKPAADQLKSMGFPMPTVADLEATLGTVDAALMAQGITPRSMETPAY